MTDKRELTYFSIDIETDGPIPFDYSMLSFAAVAFNEAGTVKGYYEANLDRLPGAKQHPDTMKNFWAKNPEAWEYCTTNTQPPEVVMPIFSRWVTDISDQRVAVCYPSGFDFTFLFSYLMRYAGKSPFMFSCIDMRSYVAGVRGCEYHRAGKSYWPKRWKPNGLKHTHKAIDDAAEQGLSFLKVHAEKNGNPLEVVTAEYLRTLAALMPKK